jgi:hypothetical protein
MSRVSVQERISGVLRQNITDINTERTANWIYPDKPRLLAIASNRNNFPRISVTGQPPTTKGEMGLGGTETEDEVSLDITVFTIKDMLLTVRTDVEEFTYSDEEVTELSEEPITAASITGTKNGEAYTFINIQDYILLDNNGDGRFDSISWVSAPDSNTSFTVTAIRQLANSDLSEWLAHECHMYLRDNWRDDLPDLYDYQKSNPTTLEELDGQVFKTVMRIRFSGVNLGD